MSFPAFPQNTGTGGWSSMNAGWAALSGAALPAHNTTPPPTPQSTDQKQSGPPPTRKATPLQVQSPMASPIAPLPQATMGGDDHKASAVLVTNLQAQAIRAASAAQALTLANAAAEAAEVYKPRYPIPARDPLELFERFSEDAWQRLARWCPDPANPYLYNGRPLTAADLDLHPKKQS